MSRTAVIILVLCIAGSAPFVTAELVSRPDQIVLLHICQTEHDLEELIGWETTDPARYREATRNGKITPVEAARESAGAMVAADRIRCDDNNAVVLEKYRVPGDARTAYPEIMNPAGLEKYCPRTMKQYGYPCR